MFGTRDNQRMLYLGKTLKILIAMAGIIQVILHSIQQDMVVYFPTELLNVITLYLLRTEKWPVAAFLNL